MTQFGILRILVLKTLSEKSLNGNQIVKEIESKTGRKFSYGSLYPLLSKLVEGELISIINESNHHIYSITNKGKEVIEHSSKKSEEILNRIHELVNSLGILGYNEKEINSIKKKMNMQNLEYLFMQENFVRFKQDLFSLDFNKNKEEINKIIKEAGAKLRRLKK